MTASRVFASSTAVPVNSGEDFKVFAAFSEARGPLSPSAALDVVHRTQVAIKPAAPTIRNGQTKVFTVGLTTPGMVAPAFARCNTKIASLVAGGK